MSHRCSGCLAASAADRSAFRMDCGQGGIILASQSIVLYIRKELLTDRRRHCRNTPSRRTNAAALKRAKRLHFCLAMGRNYRQNSFSGK